MGSLPYRYALKYFLSSASPFFECQPALMYVSGVCRHSAMAKRSCEFEHSFYRFLVFFSLIPFLPNYIFIYFHLSFPISFLFFFLLFSLNIENYICCLVLFLMSRVIEFCILRPMHLLLLLLLLMSMPSSLCPVLYSTLLNSCF